MDQLPVSKLLERPGSVSPSQQRPQVIDRLSPTHGTYLDLPVDLPMLAPEAAVLAARKKQTKDDFKASHIGELTLPSDHAQLRKECMLTDVPVGIAMHILECSAEEGGYFTSQSFKKAVQTIFMSSGQKSPSADVIDRLFSSMQSYSHPGKVSHKAVATAVALLTGGTQAEKISAIFALVDTDHDKLLSEQELVAFFLLIFENVLTRPVMGIMNANGVSVASPCQLAKTTALECITMCDLNKDGYLSLEEFTKWFKEPRLSPFLPVSPFAGMQDSSKFDVPEADYV